MIGRGDGFRAFAADSFITRLTLNLLVTMRIESFLNLGIHDFHRIVYYEWGASKNDRILACVHGMTRNGRDFDYLAEALSDIYRVICPDLPGRGESDWLSFKEDYDYPLYCAAMSALLARLQCEEVDWVGTSMGGMIGIILASIPNTPIRRLVLNDVGPFISKQALERIAQYVGTDPRFDTLEEAERYIRSQYAAFGDLTDDQWAHQTRHYTRRTEDGDLGLNYDPGIAHPLRKPLEDVDLFPVWGKVKCPTLILRGGDSDVLLAETVQRMMNENPHAELVEFPGIGHVPPLVSRDQIDIVRDWLLK